MRIRNVHCNWLAKNMLHEYISKRFLAGHPANTGHELVVSRESIDTSASVAFIFSTVLEHPGEWTYSTGSNIPYFFRDRAKQPPSFVRVVQPISTALTKQTECLRCKEGFSAVVILVGLTLNCLPRAKLTSVPKLIDNSLNVFLSEQVHLNGLTSKPFLY